MATYVPAKKNTAYIVYVDLVSQADTKLFKVTPTIAAGDFQVSIDGAAFANLATLPVVTPAGGSAVKINLSAAEMNGDNIHVQCRDAAGAEWCDLSFNIQTAARQVDDLAYPATTGRSMVVDAAGLVDANVVKMGPTGAGTAQTAGDLVGGLLSAQAEPVQGTPAANASVIVKISHLYKAWRNRSTQTGSQYAVYNDDAVTVDHKATFSDNGTTADRGEMATGP